MGQGKEADMAGDAVSALFAAAREARENAYAPYSRFRVGAALRSAQGGVFASCNVENAAYPVGVCAEAGAIAAMVAAGHRRIVEVAVIGDAPEPVTPCGACRQRLREFADARTLVHCGTVAGRRASFTMAELLPVSFGPEHLPEKPATDG
jgi:cytidine deaminase